MARLSYRCRLTGGPLIWCLALHCRTKLKCARSWPAEYLASQIGTELTDLFFRPYTKKMWALDLEDMDAAVVKRIPLRFDDEDHYFPADKFQVMPRDGYTSVITR